MRKPSDTFIGTYIGLLLIFLVPSNSMNSEVDIVRWLVVFPGLGAIIGAVVSILRHRRTPSV